MATAFVTASVAGMKEKNKKINAISRHGYNSRLQHVTTKPSSLYLREKVKFVLSLVVTYSIFFFPISRKSKRVWVIWTYGWADVTDTPDQAVKRFGVAGNLLRI